MLLLHSQSSATLRSERRKARHGDVPGSARPRSGRCRGAGGNPLFGRPRPQHQGRLRRGDPGRANCRRGCLQRAGTWLSRRDTDRFLWRLKGQDAHTLGERQARDRHRHSRASAIKAAFRSAGPLVSSARARSPMRRASMGECCAMSSPPTTPRQMSGLAQPIAARPTRPGSSGRAGPVASTATSRAASRWPTQISRHAPLRLATTGGPSFSGNRILQAGMSSRPPPTATPLITAMIGTSDPAPILNEPGFTPVMCFPACSSRLQRPLRMA
jgi:hypothetical protein